MVADFEKLFAANPEEAQNEIYYVSTNEPHLLTPRLVELICAHINSQAFQTLQYVLWNRPELIHAKVVERVVETLAIQVNQAFYFIREVVKARPEFAPLCTLAFFECVVREPHGWMKREMLQDIVSMAGRSHVASDLERALREPPAAGSRAARVLMAILFRQKLRAKQRALFDALQHATYWPQIWTFTMFLIEHSDPKAISSAAAERFLENAYRLSNLVTPYEYEQLLVERLKLDVPPVPVEECPEHADLYGKLCHFAGERVELAPVVRWRNRAADAAREIAAIGDRHPERRRTIETRLASNDTKELKKKVLDALRAGIARVPNRLIEEAMLGAYRSALKRVLGRDYDLARVEPGILPSFLYYERLGRLESNRKYLARLIEDRLEGRPHDWLWTEPPAAAWAKRMESRARLDRWRRPFAREYEHERARRGNVEADLAQTRALFRRLGIEVATYDEMREKIPEMQGRDPAIVGEIELNLQRIRARLQAGESDYQGRIRIEVETDPFRYLFMGEYGFASCLSLRGPYVWSAVSNAIDVDKVVLWAKDEGDNIVGRRLIALTPQGIISYRTYANQYGLGLDSLFERFLSEYASHCGTTVTHDACVGPLLSDEWYDDGSL